MTEQDIAKRRSGTDRDRLVRDNMGFVVAMAKQYVNKGLPLDDLVSEGYVGLVRAAGKYDDSRGAKFTSYAANYVRASILQALENNDCKCNEGAGARIDSIASDVASTDNRVEQITITDDITIALKNLNSREREVIMHCFGIGMPQMTFAEIGEKLGMSRERVRQIRKKALRHLKKGNAEMIKDKE